MTSDLSSFAARLREFISRCSGNSALTASAAAPARHTPVEAEFNDLAVALFALQFKYNAPFRKFCEGRKCFPDSVTHWSQIPAIPASAFKELDLTCLPPAERTTVFHSSGTTAQRPSRHFHSAESLALYEASLWPWFSAHVASRIANSQLPIAKGPSSITRGPSAIGYWPSAIILTPPPALAPHSSLVYMFEIVRRNLNWPESAFVGEISEDRSWTLDRDETLENLRDAAHQDQPVILLGTAFSFVHLLDLLAEQNLRFELPPGSRVMETGGYKGRSRSLSKPELHALITERLGIPATHIICEYGMSELSSQAYDLEGRSEKGEVRRVAKAAQERAFRFPPWTRARVISPETNLEVAEGETGLLQVFDLANVFSVMAIQTEDLAIRRGNSFELIGRAPAAEPRGCSLAIADSQSPIARS